MPRRKRFMYIAFAVIGLVALAVLPLAIWLFATVDDWSRDLTTNHAATSPSAKQPSLHPIVSERSREELADVVVDAAQKLKGWTLAAREESKGEITIRLVRTTALMRFKDDITVHIRAAENQPPPSRSEITAESRSRIGKGDFGQNPRNLAELMDKIRFMLP